MSLNDSIKEYLLNNPHLMRSKYADTAKRFGTNYEQIRNIARKLREENSDVELKEKEVINFQETKKEAKILINKINHINKILYFKLCIF